MRIAVVDDEKSIFEIVQRELREFAKRKDANIHVDCFTDDKLLLMELDEGKMYDVYFLDIELGKSDGITLAKKIREHQSFVYIIFVTNYIQYAIEGYEVKAYQYILKDKVESKLQETMELIYEDYTDSLENYFTIQTNLRYEKILYRDIYYVYKDKKNSVFVTKQGNTHVRMTLREVYDNLLPEEFIYVDRGYIANIRYIKSFQKQEIILMNNEVLPVSRPNIAEVKVKIGRYWKNRV